MLSGFAKINTLFLSYDWGVAAPVELHCNEGAKERLKVEV